MPIRQRPSDSLVSAAQFGPRYTGGSWIVPSERIKQLQSEFAQYPGRAPGGSGDTGVGRWDSNGYRQMLEDQQEYAKLNGGRVEMGPDMGSTRTISQATGMPNYAAFSSRGFGGPLPASVGGAEINGALQGIRRAIPNYEAHDQFMGRFGRR